MPVAPGRAMETTTLPRRFVRRFGDHFDIDASYVWTGPANIAMPDGTRSARGLPVDKSLFNEAKLRQFWRVRFIEKWPTD